MVSLNNLLKWVSIAVLLLAAWFGVQSSQAKTIQATQLALVSPAACPPPGCAAGQTLDLRASFDLANLDPAPAPNVQVCLYTPTNWVAESLRIDAAGAGTGAAYQPGTANCGSAPEGYVITGGVSAQISPSAAGDQLDLGFRIGRTATSSGSVMVRVYQKTAAGWQPPVESSAVIGVTPTSAIVYAANDAAACGSSSPCYLNSGADSAGGMGTALKDAIDAQPVSVTILGEYAVKSNAVWVDKAVIIQGSTDSRITYAGAS